MIHRICIYSIFLGKPLILLRSPSQRRDPPFCCRICPSSPQLPSRCNFTGRLGGCWDHNFRWVLLGEFLFKNTKERLKQIGGKKSIIYNSYDHIVDRHIIHTYSYLKEVIHNSGTRHFVMYRSVANISQNADETIRLPIQSNSPDHKKPAYFVGCLGRRQEQPSSVKCSSWIQLGVNWKSLKPNMAANCHLFIVGNAYRSIL